jgi:hypothetical protein
MAAIYAFVAECEISNNVSSIDNSFVYAALIPKGREIRLLSLLLGPVNFPLRVTLHHKNLDTQRPPAYAALS